MLLLVCLYFDMFYHMMAGVEFSTQSIRVAVSDLRAFQSFEFFLLEMLSLCGHHDNCEVVPQIRFDLYLSDD